MNFEESLAELNNIQAKLNESGNTSKESPNTTIDGLVSGITTDQSGNTKLVGQVSSVDVIAQQHRQWAKLRDDAIARNIEK